MYQLNYTLLGLLSVIFVANAKLPNYIQKCKRHDSNFDDCLKKQTENVIAILSQGDESIGLPKLVPVTLPRVVLSPVPEFTFNLKDVNGYGIQNFVLNRVNMDFKKSIFEINSIITHGRWEGNYEAKGLLYKNTFDHTGFANITFDNCRADYTAEFEPVNINGDYYLQMKESAFILHPEKTTYFFSAHGPKINETEANILMNMANVEYPELNKELLPTVKVVSAPVLTNIINLVLKAAPMCELFD